MAPLESEIFAPIANGKRFLNHEASIRDFAAHSVVYQAIKVAIGLAPSSPHGPGPVVDPRFPPVLPPHISKGLGIVTKSPGPIGIIGAGAAGLYTAMILQSLGIEYEILEANDRIGGRLFTHRFNGEAGYTAPVGSPGRYDYFDVGAMRFPRIPFMTRVFDLFETLGIDKLLVEYHLSADNNLEYFNTMPPLNSTVTSVQAMDDYFRVSVPNGGTVPTDFIQQPVSFWTGQVYKHYKDLFAELDNEELTQVERLQIFQEAWKELITQDHHSTRSFMRAGLNGVQPYPGPVIEWLEMFDSATGLYDQAFVESVMDSLDFDWPYPAVSIPPKGESETQWFCIDGGSDHIAHEMARQLKHQPQINRRVTKIAEGPNGDIEVTVADEVRPRRYSQVISTVPLGCLAAIDIDGCNLLYSQKQAIRALKYDASTKIGIKFENRWWQDSAIMGEATIRGGTSSTDVPPRVCVYPSYGLDCEGAPGILLASYTWAQDALRVGSIVQSSAVGKSSSPLADDLLLELTLNNLSKMHDIPREKFGPVLDYYAHSFYHDEHARGAFALFGPGQFGHPGDQYSLFASIKAPAANGKFHIAGEATSVHHAWVLGSLNSAWRAVYNALIGQPVLQAQLIKQWGIPDEENEFYLHALSELALARYL
ncbi:hypothetical protein Hypma_008040 [Hypsizygus marmoreus]|uniref:Amine oxidase domain-containing protein n=1 Tax=Hypsizygus marmoreus TaxID=39966 RepID=A0A369JZ54_HYPMA|nr:hypothetical protein Hypma_008040 [Hypsizygus marmoreus]